MLNATFIGQGGVFARNTLVSVFQGIRVNGTNGTNFYVPSQLGSLIDSNASFSLIQYANANLFYNSDSTQTVDSPVVSLEISNISDGQTLPAPVQITISISGGKYSELYRCIYYSFANSSWKQDGCALVKVVNVSEGIDVICNCSHLTNFAVGRVLLVFFLSFLGSSYPSCF
jgi:hypothetical protein